MNNRINFALCIIFTQTLHLELKIFIADCWLIYECICTAKLRISIFMAYQRAVFGMPVHQGDSSRDVTSSHAFAASSQFGRRLGFGTCWYTSQSPARTLQLYINRRNDYLSDRANNLVATLRSIVSASVDNYIIRLHGRDASGFRDANCTRTPQPPDRHEMIGNIRERQRER